MKPRHGRLAPCCFVRLSCLDIAATSVGEGTLWSRSATLRFDQVVSHRRHCLFRALSTYWERLEATLTLLVVSVADFNLMMVLPTDRRSLCAAIFSVCEWNLTHSDHHSWYDCPFCNQQSFSRPHLTTDRGLVSTCDAWSIEEFLPHAHFS